MVQKRIIGVTLDDFLRHNMNNSEMKRKFKCREIYKAVTQLQQQVKYLHGDVHAENIMVQSLKDGTVVGLVDWDNATKLSKRSRSYPMPRLQVRPNTDEDMIRFDCKRYGFIF
jgi:RIO-like serine/threonine protein kinase